jgi:hypothetical protein
MHRATLPPQDGAEPVDEVPRLEQKCPLTPVMSLLGAGAISVTPTSRGVRG